LEREDSHEDCRELDETRAARLEARGDLVLRQLIREILKENLQSFLDKTAGVEYTADTDVDPTFEKYPVERSAARKLKSIWRQEADHKFMDSVTKIHWMKHPSRGNIMTLVNGSKKNEISTMGYLNKDGSFRNFDWGDVGFRIEGRTTIASNEMDALFTGYFGGDDLSDRSSKYKSSGIPKRPSQYAKDIHGEYYILDEASFDPKGVGMNEFIVDNWRVTGVLLTENAYMKLSDVLRGGGPKAWNTIDDKSKKSKGELWTEIFETIKEIKVPYMKKEQANLAEDWLDEAR
jgi:hypothetical protein